MYSKPICKWSSRLQKIEVSKFEYASIMVIASILGKDKVAGLHSMPTELVPEIEKQPTIQRCQASGGLKLSQ